MKNTKCPTCQSPQPHLHPAMQFEGEVQPCRDAYHKTITPQNTAEKISKVITDNDRTMEEILEHRASDPSYGMKIVE